MKACYLVQHFVEGFNSIWKESELWLDQAQVDSVGSVHVEDYDELKRLVGNEVVKRNVDNTSSNVEDEVGKFDFGGSFDVIVIYDAFARNELGIFEFIDGDI